MNEDTYDIVVVGSGSGGAEAALLASRRGARVLLVEKNLLGGGAIHTGTLPMRSLMGRERLLRQLREDGYGGDGDVTQFSEWIQKQRRTASRLGEQLERDLSSAGAEVAQGEARLLGAGRLHIADGRPDRPASRNVQAGQIILATGSRPREAEQVWSESAIGSSRRFMTLGEKPDRLVIIGGGHIGCEFACVYSTLGTDVTIIEKGERLLPEMDREAGERLRLEFGRRGIRVRLNEEARPVWGQMSAEFAVAGILPDGEEVYADKLLLATGRVPNVTGLGLENAGVKFSVDCGIEVDEHLQTCAPGIFAIGDVNGICTLSDSARDQARIAVDNAFGARRSFSRNETIRRIHTDPPIVAIGVMENEARAAGRAVCTAIMEFTPPSMLRTGAVAGGSLIKLVADAESRELIGGMIVGEHALESAGDLRATVLAGSDVSDHGRSETHVNDFSIALWECRVLLSQG